MELRPLLVLALLAPAQAYAQTELKVVSPEGFVAGRESSAVIVAVDATGAMVASDVAPKVSVSGGKAGAVEKIAPGIWRVGVTPSSAGAVTVEAKAGDLAGKLAGAARPERDAVVALTLSQTTLKPDQRGAVTATIDVTDAAGVPLDGVTPQLDVTSGTVTAPQKTAAGKWTAKITPPAKKHPLAVLAVATLPGRDALPAVATIAMHGRATVPITTEPNAKVVVRVGKKSWNLTANKYGEVEAKIEASPTELSMEVESTDSAGNKGVNHVSLSPPPYERLWMRASAGPTGIDARSRLTILAVALEKNGNVKKGGTLSADVGGTAVPLEAKGDVFLAEPRLALAPGALEVKVATSEDKAAATVTITPAPAVAVTIIATPDVVHAAGSPTQILAQLVDASGKPVPAGSVAFSVEGLALMGMRSEPGKATASVTLVKGTKPTDVWLSAKSPGPGFSISARRPLAILAGPPSKAEIISVAPPNLIADGSSGAEVRVRITDAHGYPVTKLQPKLLASAGEVQSLKELGEGEYLFLLRAPPSSGAGNATLTVEAGPARAESSVRFMRPPTKTHLAVGLTGESNLGALANMGAWVEARRVIGGGDSPLSLTARLSGRQGSMTARPAGNPVAYDVTLTQVAGSLGARYRFGSSMSRWAFFAGGAAVIGQVTVEQSPSPQSDDRMFAGARAALQAERSAGAGAWLFELGYEHATVLDNSGTNELVSGPITGLAVSVGYRHGF